jgi:hypothetical protein
VVRWHLRRLPTQIMKSSMTMMILFLYMHTRLRKRILCLRNGNKWKLIKYLMDCSQAESNGIKISLNKIRKINCLMPGLVVPQLTEVSSILHPWNKNYLAITNLIILLSNIFSLIRSWRNGKKWTSKIDHITSSQVVSRKWDTFLSMIGSFNRDFKDVWICTYVLELRRKNLTLILIH